MSEEPGIVYSVKELISRLDGKLDMITNILTSKADRSDVIALEHRVGQIEEKVGKLYDHEETKVVATRDTLVRRRWIVTTVISAGVAVVAVAGVVFQAVIH